ncbi:MAG: TVP38/TMEM64 family protein, partial [Candidatus Tectomicrobia bacterium]|nr:TVP38/TMEM64 family protein [Candidatus Tectomicrobia bacterium]
IAGGLLFGALWGTVLTVVSATLGATILFHLAQTALGDTLRSRAGAWLPRLEAGFKANALSYLLVLRLVPLFPFFIVNLVPALLGVPSMTFIAGTFLGIIPGSFVYTTVGAGLGSVFDAGETFSLAGVLTPQLLMALVGLAVLAMLPVAYKKWLARR